jgi:hypothetical protein
MKFHFWLVLIILSLFSCSKLSKETFVKISSSRSGIDFINELVENDTLNYKFPICTWAEVFRWATSIMTDWMTFFSPELVPNKLYLNKGT